MKKLLLLLTFILSQGLIAAPIHNAAMRGDVAEVERLLNSGVDVNVRDEHNMIPLHWAAYDGQSGTVKLLLDKGADINAREDTFNRTPFHWAVSSGDTDTVRLFLGGVVDINARRNRLNRTSLHEAAFDENIGIIELLINHPFCDHTIVDDEGNTPEDLAISRDHQDIVDMLHNALSVEQKLVKSERNDVLQLLAAKVANEEGISEEDYNKLDTSFRHCSFMRFITNIRKEKKPSSLTDQSVSKDEAGPSGYHSDGDVSSDSEEELQ